MQENVISCVLGITENETFLFNNILMENSREQKIVDVIIDNKWMFCSRPSHNMISKLHERSLRIILNDYSSDFNIMLENNNDICNHHRNIQTMSIEVFKMNLPLQ